MRNLGEVISLGARLGVGGLFWWAAYPKVWDPAAFAGDMAQYELMPLALVNPASAALAWLELVIALLLILGLFTRAAALWASGLLLFFTGLMIYAGITGAGYDCGCFPGQGEGHAAGFAAALRDLGFLLPALWLLKWPGKWLSLERVFGWETAWPEGGSRPGGGGVKS